MRQRPLPPHGSTARAVGVCRVAWLIQLLILGVAAALVGVLTLGGGD